jgi:superfamily II DNA/RNA helicase
MLPIGSYGKIKKKIKKRHEHRAEKKAVKLRKVKSAVRKLTSAALDAKRSKLKSAVVDANGPDASVGVTAAPSDDTAESFMKRHEIVVHAEDAPPPFTTMAAAPFPAPIQELLSRFSEPTAIQGASWPMALSGRDVLAISRTGSGKTLAFLLPAIVRCVAERKAHPVAAERTLPSPVCLVMAPTRELVLQTTQQGELFGRALGVRTVAVYGGAPKWGQVNDLNVGCEIVVATPGRMLDMLDLASTSGFGVGGKRPVDGAGHGTHAGMPGGRSGGGSYSGYSSGDGQCCSLANCAILVLDEADRMLDMGFERDCHTIAAQVPKPRQVLLFSATWPVGVQRVADALLSPRHARVTVGAVGNRLAANTSVQQHVRLVAPKDKWAAFVEILSALRRAPAPPKLALAANPKCTGLGSAQNGAPKPTSGSASLGEAGVAAARATAGGSSAARAERHAERILIFCNTRRDVNAIGAYLAGPGGLACNPTTGDRTIWRCDTISGDRSQKEREAAIKAFRSGEISVLVATDVAARGLDIAGIDHVINYDFPTGEGGAEEYVHRIGRTARAGATGTAHTLFTFADSRHAAALATLLADAGQPIPEGLTELGSAKRPRSHHGGRGVKAKQLKDEELALELARQQVEEAKQARAEEFRAEAERNFGG